MILSEYYFKINLMKISRKIRIDLIFCRLYVIYYINHYLIKLIPKILIIYNCKLCLLFRIKYTLLVPLNLSLNQFKIQQIMYYKLLYPYSEFHIKYIKNVYNKCY